ncbi:MAG TPA: transferase [Flavobacteriales bacterium]|nr:transferase [Flavobacteriales bacterium]
MMSEHKQLIVYLREPKIGKVKSRLAKAIGDKRALEVYRELLDTTLDVCDDLDVAKNLSFSEHSKLKRAGYTTSTQVCGNLGERMLHSFLSFGEKGKRPTVLIGTDCPGINSVLLREAFETLNECDLVLGPCEDGGYYLIGMSKAIPELFQEIPWSTSRVLEQTMKKAKTLGLSVGLLDELYDVDVEEDYRRYKSGMKAKN